MKKILITAVMAVCIINGRAQQPPVKKGSKSSKPATADSIHWQGQIGAKRILLTAVPKQGGLKAAWFTSPENSIWQLKADTLYKKGDTLIVQGPLYFGIFYVKRSEDGKELNGYLLKDTVRKPLVLTSVNAMQPLVLPQTPKAPFTYTSENVQYYNADSSIHFGGTLTIPKEGAKHPAVVIVSGTGQQDRDGNMAGHPMFAVIADYLSRNGIAVLRVDDRGVNETTGNYFNTTTREFAADALAGIRYLQGRKEIDAAKTGLIGHSEGGAAASIAASESKDVAFIISLSGVGITGMKALLLQNEAIVNSSPITAVNKQRFNKVNKVLFEIVYKNASDTALEQRMRTAYRQWQADDSAFIAPLDKKQTDHFFYPFERYLSQATGPWYRGFMTYEPSQVFPLIKVPVLAINGDKDIISLATPNLEGFQRYVPAGLIQTWQVPGLNHLYQHCVTCATNEYSELSETFAPEVLERMRQFILSVK